MESINYNSFYFLHIPKCDGRRFIDTIVNPLKKENPWIEFIEDNNASEYAVFSGYPPKLKNPILEASPIRHQGWDSRISDNTYIVSIMRDPIERAASWYTYLTVKAIERLPQYKQNSDIHLFKEKFIECVELDKRFHNATSKMLLDDVYRNRSLMSNDDLLLKNSNKEIVFNNAKRINLLIRSDDFNIMDKRMLLNKICSDIKCSASTPNDTDFILSKKYTFDASKRLYESLTSADKQHLKQYFNVDYSVYEDNSLFWNPK